MLSIQGKRFEEITIRTDVSNPERINTGRTCCCANSPDNFSCTRPEGHYPDYLHIGGTDTLTVAIWLSIGDMTGITHESIYLYAKAYFSSLPEIERLFEGN